MRLLLWLLLFVVAGAGFWVQHNSDSQNEPGVETSVPTVTLGEKTLEVSVANTEASRQQGLSGVSALEDKEGKLFIFDYSDRHGFWMKDMLFSIDIIWIDKEMKIVHIAKNVSPDTYPVVFVPEEPALYVLETSANFTEVNNIQVGDMVWFDLMLQK